MFNARLLGLILPLTTLGCATSMSIRSMEPANVHVGSANHLVILDGQGRRSAREFVNIELASQARSSGYYTVEDRSEDGFEVRVMGRNALVEGEGFAFGHDQVGLRVDVLEWTSERDVNEVTRRDPQGKSYVERVPVHRGNVLLAVTLFDDGGRAFLAETEYEGTAMCPVDTVREDAVEQAARQAIANFLRDVTPSQVVTRVKLDDEDPGQEFILDTAKAGNVGQAANDMCGYFESHPHSASAAYNLAVFLEAMGDFQAALEMYDTALSLGGQDFYSAARAGCARRLASSEALRSESR